MAKMIWVFGQGYIAVDGRQRILGSGVIGYIRYSNETSREVLTGRINDGWYANSEAFNIIVLIDRMQRYRC